jgi:hypothetical protein
MGVHNFLLIYDRVHRVLDTVQEFDDREEAARAYVAAERAALGNACLEVVLLGADSLETIKQTHGQYFDAPAGRSRFLDAAVPPKPSPAAC